MKRDFLIYAAMLLLAGGIATSCHRDTMDHDPLQIIEEMGTADFSTLKVKFADELETVVRASAVNVDGFLVKITDGESTQSAPVYENTYGNLPDTVMLRTGNYGLSVESHELKPAEWEAPWYHASEPFVIETEQTTELGTQTCTIGNIKVTVEYSEEMLAAMGRDCKTTVTIDRGSLDYAPTESRAGFFAAAAESNAMTVEFSGTLGGTADRITQVFNNVRAGQHRILSFTYTPPPAEGDVTFGVNVDLSCRVIDLNLNVDITEEVIPENGDENDPAKAPKIVWREGDIQSAEPTRIVKTGTDNDGNGIYTPEVNIDVTAEYKIRNLYVEIISDILTKDVLTGVGLDSSFDLVNPGELASKLGKNGDDGLGFPIGQEVENQTAVEFSITNFIPLLDMVASGSGIRNAVHQFRLTVVDRKGNREVQTLKLITD